MSEESAFTQITSDVRVIPLEEEELEYSEVEGVPDREDEVLTSCLLYTSDAADE